MDTLPKSLNELSRVSSVSYDILIKLYTRRFYYASIIM